MVAFNNSSNGSEAAQVSSLTYSFTVNSGNNRLLLVGTVTYQNSNPHTISAITFNGDSLTNFNSVVWGGGEDDRNELWRMVAPDVATGNVVITPSATPCDIISGAVAYDDVDQTTPLDGSQTATVGTTATSITLTITSAVNDLAFGMVGGFDKAAITVGAGQTQRFERETNDFSNIHGSEEPGAASVTWTTSWTNGSSSPLGANGGNINNAPAGGRTTLNTLAAPLGSHLGRGLWTHGGSG